MEKSPDQLWGFIFSTFHSCGVHAPLQVPPTPPSAGGTCPTVLRLQHLLGILSILIAWSRSWSELEMAEHQLLCEVTRQVLKISSKTYTREGGMFGAWVPREKASPDKGGGWTVTVLFGNVYPFQDFLMLGEKAWFSKRNLERQYHTVGIETVQFLAKKRNLFQ